MDLELAGKAAIVTGGSGGIGKAIAAELAREGVDLVICARRREPLEEIARELAKESGRRVIPVVADTTSRDSVEHLVEEAISALGRADILVNSAAAVGGLVRSQLAEATEESLLEDINTKVVGYFRCAKAAVPHMQARGWGRIINIGGLSGRHSANIGALRNAAIVHLTKTLSEQLGPDGITVNLVHPDATRTERSGPRYAEQARQEGITVEEIEKRVVRNIAIRRIVDAREIAYVVAFLASPKSAAITGESISVAGGSDRAVFQRGS